MFSAARLSGVILRSESRRLIHGIKLLAPSFLRLRYLPKLPASFCEPTPKLANRVRPYTAASRSQLGRNPDAALFVRNGMPTTAGGVIQRLNRPMVESLVRLLTRVLGSSFNDEHLALRLRQADILTDVPEDDRVFEYRISQVTSGLTYALALGAAGQAIRHQPACRARPTFWSVSVVGVAKKSAGLGKGIENRRERIGSSLYDQSAPGHLPPYQRLPNACGATSEPSRQGRCHR